MQVADTVSFLNQTSYYDQGNNLKTKTIWWRLGPILGTRPRPTNTEKLCGDCLEVRHCLTGWKLLGHITALQMLTWLTCNRRINQVRLHSGTPPVGLYGDMLLYAAIQMEYATMMMVMTMMSACSID